MRLAAVVLAAGAGRRFGGRKLLAPFEGGVLLDGALHAAFASPGDRVVVVAGQDAAAVGAAAEAFASRVGQTARLSLVHAADHAAGMAASLKTGIGALPEETDAAFVFLGDMPRIPPHLPARLADALAEHAAAAPEYGGRRGHPVLFARRLFPALLTLEGDQGARQVLERLGADLITVPVDDDGVLFDVDIPGDLHR